VFSVANYRAIEICGHIKWENLKKLSQGTVPIIIRIPIIPRYNDQEENIKSTAEIISNYGSSTARFIAISAISAP